MKVEVSAKKPEVKLELGDVILWRDCTYIVITHKDDYWAGNFDGVGGLFGTYSSLEALNKSFKERFMPHEVEIYKEGKYKLVLEEI